MLSVLSNGRKQTPILKTKTLPQYKLQIQLLVMRKSGCHMNSQLNGQGKSATDDQVLF
jgi:hypothetical protein